ncbi:hypothetical protein [Enterococcus sp. DIV0086]|uniref:hypothetical protein n=1 Tax=Enterococcus sp. DIV0086 TaxID=2774655 RepID=UPI003D2AFB48
MTNENKKTTHQKKDSRNEISAEYIDTGIINPLINYFSIAVLITNYIKQSES